MKYIKLELAPIQTNCYIVFNEIGGEGYIIDPASNAEKIAKVISENGLKPKGILLTHGHFDHIGASDDLRKLYKIPLCIHENDAEMLENATSNCSASFIGYPILLNPADVILKSGDVLNADGESLRVLHTPGHSRGSLSFICDNYIFSGDTVFKGSYGRFDLPGGSFNELKNSIQMLLSLDEALIICPGHGDETCVKDEVSMYNFI